LFVKSFDKFLVFGVHSIRGSSFFTNFRLSNASALDVFGVQRFSLLLATRREDPDTLFFNRRLRLSGNTELGLYVKNFLDSLEPQELLGPLFKRLEQMTSLFEQVGKFQSVAFFKQA
jgi:predicted lipid carrier protein YhbT